VHESRPGAELLSLRFLEMKEGRKMRPIASTPLFASGQEAYDHGVKDIDFPSAPAKKAISCLLLKLAKRTIT
jgi:hypothetical protein